MHAVNGNGVAVPALGFGTWELRGSTAQRLVEAALAIGYRHIDTAQMYGNEAEVGAGLKASGLARDAYFLTTKIGPTISAAASWSGRRPSGVGSWAPCPTSSSCTGPAPRSRSPRRSPR